MNKYLPLFILLFFAIDVNAQVYINEITSDAGNNDGNPQSQTAEFVELYNAGATAVNIGGWIVVDDDAAIRIPAGEMIPAGGYYLLGSYGLETGPGGTSGTGLSCTTCDYNGITLNGNWGNNMPNVQKTGAIVIGSTCAGGNKDESWLLLDNTANLVDAIYFGDAANTCGNTPSTFTLPAFGTLPAITIDNAVGPHDGTTPVVGVTTNLTNTNNIAWSYAGPRINGCNSSYQRIPNGGTFANGAISNTSLQTVGTYALGAQPTTQPTNHPTPGVDNTLSPFSFSVTGAGTPTTAATTPTATEVYTVCNATPITFTYTVNNYQNVQPTLNYANGRIGSYVEATGAGASAAAAWPTITGAGSGTTTLSYTVTPPVGITDYNLVWEDYIVNCCGSSSFNVTNGNNNTSTAWECYERRKVQIIRVEPMSASNINISCPTDFSPGTVNLSTLMSGGYNLSYELFANGISQGVNTSGVFNLANTLASPITATVTDGSGCNTSITITINDNCKAPPICPTIALDATNSSAAGSYCPGSAIDLCIDVPASIDLPEGGLVTWYKGTSATFDPFASPTSDLVDTAQIITSGPAPYTGAPRLNEVCYDPANNDGTTGANGEWIEIACNPSSSIGCYLLTDGDWVVQIPNGTTCPASGFYVIGTSNSNQGSPATSVAVDLDIGTCATCNVGGSGAITMTNGGEFVSLFDPSLTQIDNITFDGPSAGNSPGGSESFTYSTGCGAGSASITHSQVATANDAGNGSSVARGADGTGTWAGQSNPTAGATNGVGSTTTISCKQYMVTADDCNNSGNLFFRATVTPIDAACSATNATTAAVGGITVVCPTATISGDDTICNGTGTPSTVDLDITATSSLAGYIPWISINGVSTAFPALVGAGPIYPITVNAAGSYEIDSLVSPSTATCEALITSPNFAEVFESNPPMVIIQGGCTGVPPNQPTVLVSPQEAVSNPIFSIVTPAGATPSSNSDGSFVLPANYTGPITAQMVLGSCTTLVSSTIGPCPPYPAVLPVQIVDFDGYIVNHTVQLMWTAFDEQSLSHYEIERGTDGIYFEKINRTKAKGFEGQKEQYSILDKKPKTGNNYYRLKIYDLDGKFAFSKVIVVNLNAELTRIDQVYPNPAQDIINIGFQVAREEKVNIQIMDIRGRLVQTKSVVLNKGYALIKLPTAALAAGQYLISIPRANRANLQTSFIRE